jgi:uncharacterized protein YijF (DUF1287 family)
MSDAKAIIAKLDKLDSKLDKLDSRVDNIDVTLGKQETSLAEHIRRSNNLEEWSARQDKDIAEVKSFKDMSIGALKVLASIGAVITLLVAVYTAVK